MKAVTLIMGAKIFCLALFGILMLTWTGCRTVDAAANATDLADESRVVFARATEYTMWFGSESPNDYFEITYCRLAQNDAGQPVAEVGIRYRGGTSWTNWFRPVPEHVSLTAVCNFYPTSGAQAEGPAIYSTNKQILQFSLGQTTAFKAVCPVQEAMGFQLVLGK